MTALFMHYLYFKNNQNLPNTLYKGELYANKTNSPVVW